MKQIETVQTLVRSGDSRCEDLYQTYPKLVNNLSMRNNNNIEEKEIKKKHKMKIKWLNIVGITLFHVFTLTYLSLFPLELYLSLYYPEFQLRLGYPKWQTFIWIVVTAMVGGFGVTVGAHRLWTHRSFTASWPLRLILIICYSLAGQNRIFDWVRDHRVHHKFSETDADPHNTNRGFFFSHVGWLFVSKHPKVIEKGKLIDMQDILDDPIVSFHTRYFYYFQILGACILPSLIPCICWDENVIISLLSTATRYVSTLNITWSVNSFAHFYGFKPYDKNMAPCENIGVAIAAMGEGWHNYHHVFPWDYRASEFGSYKYNFSTFIIDVFARIGWAYNLKKPPKELVNNVARKTGDGSYENIWRKEIK